MATLGCSRATAFRSLQQLGTERSYTRLLSAWLRAGLGTQVTVVAETSPGGPLSAISQAEIDKANAESDARVRRERAAMRARLTPPAPPP